MGAQEVTKIRDEHYEEITDTMGRFTFNHAKI